MLIGQRHLHMCPTPHTSTCYLGHTRVHTYNNTACSCTSTSGLFTWYRVYCMCSVCAKRAHNATHTHIGLYMCAYSRYLLYDRYHMCKYVYYTLRVCPHMCTMYIHAHMHLYFPLFPELERGGWLDVASFRLSRAWPAADYTGPP